MPKHHMAQMYPVQVKRLGPLRGSWTMRSEGCYQVAKWIAESSNYKNTARRILEIHVLRSGRALVSGRLAAIPQPSPLYVGPALPIDSAATFANATLHHDELVTRLFMGAVDKDARLEVLEVSEVLEVRYQGETFVAGASWVVHQSLTMEGLEVPALAKIGRILEVSGDGLLSDLFIQVLRYPDIDGTRLAGCRRPLGDDTIHLAVHRA